MIVRFDVTMDLSGMAGPFHLMGVDRTTSPADAIYKSQISARTTAVGTTFLQNIFLAIIQALCSR